MRDLLSMQTADYGENPALKVPVLRASSGTWFGALNVSRALARLSGRDLRVVWPEMLIQPLLANAQELVVHALATEVTLVMARLGGAPHDGPHQSKLQTSLRNVMSWLDANVEAVLAALPKRDLSYLEVTLFCLLAHLEFRHVLPVQGYAKLSVFCRHFAERPSVRETPYCFDP